MLNCQASFIQACLCGISWDPLSVSHTFLEYCKNLSVSRDFCPYLFRFSTQCVSRRYINLDLNNFYKYCPPLVYDGGLMGGFLPLFLSQPSWRIAIYCAMPPKTIHKVELYILKCFNCYKFSHACYVIINCDI